jgi:tetratricopeptide (TPR) repeat protein
MASKRFWIALVLCLAALLSNACATGPPLTPVESGEAALASGDWRSAKKHFAEALRAEAGFGRAWLGQARAQLAGRDPEGALRSLSSLSRVDRCVFDGAGQATKAEGVEAAARLRLRRDQSEAALIAVRAWVELEPDRRGLDPLLGRALIAEAARRRWQGDPTAALTLYREACQVVPSTLDPWLGAAEILIEQNHGKAAMQLLEIARRSHPTAGQIRTLTIQALSLR